MEFGKVVRKEYAGEMLYICGMVGRITRDYDVYEKNRGDTRQLDRKRESECSAAGTSYIV